MSEATKGPWVLLEGHWNTDCDRCNEGSIGSIFSPTEDLYIAQIEHVAAETEKLDRGIQLANAHVMAASWDLLAALKAVLLIADRKADVFDAAHAAVAKAEGK